MRGSLPKNQHYVPKFLLRNFAFNKGEQVYVFDKREERVFKANIRNIASEHEFYNVQVEEYIYTIEPSLSEIETSASEIIRKILYTEDLRRITDKEKLMLSAFIAIQLQRGKLARQMLIDTDILLQERLKELGTDPEEVENYAPLDEEGAKQVAISLIRNYQVFVPHIYDKWWLLEKTPKTRPFYISDNPVALQNAFDHGPYGNLGLAVKGIEIYLPLSKTITLALLCRSHEEFVREGYTKLEFIKKQEIQLGQWDKNKGSYDPVVRLWNALETGKALRITDANHMNLNSLQVAYSSRFVYSYSNNFNLAYKMLRDNPKLKTGPPKVSSN